MQEQDNHQENSQLELFDYNNFYLKGTHPTSTVIQSRLPAFCGTKKSTKKNVELVTVQNAYGSLTYEKNRLTQRHRDIMDWVFSYHLKAIKNGDGSVTYWFNPYPMLKDFGQSKPNIEDLRNWINDMMTAIITVETKKIKINAVIITEHGYDKKSLVGDTTKFGDGILYQMTVSKRFMQFFENDLHIFYNKLLPDILKIDKAEVRAIVRFLITQEKRTKNLAYLLYLVDAINNEQDKANRYKTIRTVRKYIQYNETVKKIGITIDGNDNVSYEKHELIYFKNPNKA